MRINLDELVTNNGKELLAQEIMARKRSPNRLGTKLDSDFVKDAIGINKGGGSHRRQKVSHDMFVR